MKRIAYAGVLVCMMLIVSACGQRGGSGAATQEATVTVKRDTLRSTVGGSGTVKPAQSANLSFKATGIISDVLVKEGQQVTKDQELARLDTDLLDKQVQVAQAQRDAAQAQRQAAQAQRDAAIAQRDRLDQVSSTPAASPSGQPAGANGQAAGAGAQALDSSNASKAQVDAQVIQGSAQITQAEAQGRQADAQLQQAQINVNNATLRAPFAGTITGVNIAAGDSAGGSTAAGLGAAGGGSSAPISIADTSSYYVEATINEADIAGVKQDQTAQVTIDALGSQPITGTVSYIAPAATTTQNLSTYVVRIKLPTNVQGVRIGMNASVDINKDERQNVLVIPSSAIRTQNNQRFVRLKQGTTFVDRQIETGLSSDVNTEVTSGLNENDVIAAIGTATNQ